MFDRVDGSNSLMGSQTSDPLARLFARKLHVASQSTFLHDPLSERESSLLSACDGTCGKILGEISVSEDRHRVDDLFDHHNFTKCSSSVETETHKLRSQYSVLKRLDSDTEEQQRGCGII